jgi:hypothetical protein
LDVLGQWFVLDDPSAGAENLDDKLVLALLVAVVVWFEAGIILLLGVVMALRIAVLLALTPFIPAMIAARSLPLRIVKGTSSAVILVWTVLAVAAIPSAAALSVAFSADVQNLFTNLGFGTLLVVLVKVGSMVSALIIPIAMYQTARSSLAVPRLRNVTQKGRQTREEVQQAGQKARRAGEKGRPAVQRARSATGTASSRARSGASSAAAGFKFEMPEDRENPSRTWKAGVEARRKTEKARYYSRRTADKVREYKESFSLRSGSDSGEDGEDK